MLYLHAVSFIIVFVVANWFAGGKFHLQRKQGGPLPGRGIYYSGLALMGLFLSLYSVFGLMIGVSFLLWRLPGWYHALDMGTFADSFTRDFFVMSSRALVAFPAFIYAVRYGHVAWPIAASLMAVACVGQGLSYVIGNYGFKNTPYVGWASEGFSGAVWGVVFFLMLTAGGVSV